MKELPLIGEYAGKFTQVDDDVADFLTANNAVLRGIWIPKKKTIYCLVEFPDIRPGVTYYLHEWISFIYPTLTEAMN